MTDIPVAISRAPARSRRRGASIIEVAMVAMIIGIVGIPLMIYFQHETRGAAHTIARTIGLCVASHVMERYRDLPYQFLLDSFSGGGPSTSSVIDADALLKIIDDPDVPLDFQAKYTAWGFRREIAFREIKGSPGMGILTVSVSWKEQALPEAHTSLSRVIIDAANL